MEELLDVIIALIVIIASLVKVANRSKKVRKNAPGRTAAPVRPAAPAAPAAKPAAVQTRPVPAAPTVQPTVRPAAESVQSPDFWQEVSKALKEELGLDTQDAGHEAVGKMPEGDSRECEHGSVGGSIAYAGHQEGDEAKKSAKPRAVREEKQENDSLYRPAMNAQEMRRAVVMAEILKRPQDRMAEQARRWSAR